MAPRPRVSRRGTEGEPCAGSSDRLWRRSPRRACRQRTEVCAPARTSAPSARCARRRSRCRWVSLTPPRRSTRGRQPGPMAAGPMRVRCREERGSGSLTHSLTPRACACVWPVVACGLWLRSAAADARAWQASAPPEGGAARAARRPAHDRRRAAWQPRPPPCPGPSSVCPRLVILTPPSASGRHSLQRCIEAGPCS